MTFGGDETVVVGAIVAVVGGGVVAFGSDVNAVVCVMGGGVGRAWRGWGWGWRRRNGN